MDGEGLGDKLGAYDFLKKRRDAKSLSCDVVFG
jgi:hypothetical protein